MPHVRKSFARWIGLAISVACLAFFVHAARDVLAGMDRPADWNWGAVPAAMAPYLAAYAALAFAWYCLLHLLGLRLAAPQVLGIYLTAQFAKYLPGNVGHHAGRVYLASRAGLPPFGVGLSMLLEMLLIVGCALVLSLPLAPLLARAAQRGMSAGLALGIGAGILVALASALALRRHPLVQSAGQHLRTVLAQLRSTSIGYLAGAVALSLAGLALAGSSLLVLCGPDSAGQLVQVVALVCGAWIVGFLTPGAPAGLGVREAVLLGGLTSLFERQTAVEASVMFRVVSVGADLVALACGLLLQRIRPRPGAVPQ